MSAIVQNALRYNTTNTQRVDILGRNTGQIVPNLEQQNGDPVIGFDCSGYYYHVMRESGYDVGRLSAKGYLTSENSQMSHIAI